MMVAHIRLDIAMKAHRIRRVQFQMRGLFHWPDVLLIRIPKGSDKAFIIAWAAIPLEMVRERQANSPAAA